MEEALKAYYDEFGERFPFFGMSEEEALRIIEACLRDGEPYEEPEDVLV